MNVIIKLINGYNFTLTLNKDDTIDQLKKKIEEYNGFSPSQQKLIFNDKVLTEINENLSTCGLKDGSDVALFLYPREFNLKIHVQNDNILDFLVKPSDNLLSVKKQIQNRISMHIDEQLLLYQGEELIGNRLLSEYNILDTCCLKLIPKLREFNLRIQVQNDSFELSVKSCDDIMSVKKEIQNRISMHIDEQLLLYQGEELIGNRLLSEYNILDTCCLKLISKLGNKVDFIINLLDKPKLSLAIQSNRTVFDIKCMLQDKLGILPAEQRLIMNCRILEDYEIVSDCFRNEKIVINLLHQKRMGFLIFVKNISGSYFSLEVDNSEKIIDIKRKIENIRGWKVEDQKIIFQGKILNNEEIIDNCAFEWNSIIYVVLLKR